MFPISLPSLLLFVPVNISLIAISLLAGWDTNPSIEFLLQFHSPWTMLSDSSSYYQPPLDATHHLYIDNIA
ncbi:hypothetical protein BGW37DRAFT_483080 [Umbelopsis sp. PMI_123]|nr:hypothetical protein BGW37DRAFT_483080 [Umbelopsis sp. PMI_123]